MNPVEVVLLIVLGLAAFLVVAAVLFTIFVSVVLKTYNRAHHYMVVYCEDPEKTREFITSNRELCLTRKDLFHQDSVLHRSADIANRDAVKLLLELGADPNCRNRFGETPLHKACRSRDVCSTSKPIVWTLLQGGADPSTVDHRGNRTAREMAEDIGNPHLVKMIDEWQRKHDSGRISPDKSPQT